LDPIGKVGKINRWYNHKNLGTFGVLLGRPILSWRKNFKKYTLDLTNVFSVVHRLQQGYLDVLTVPWHVEFACSWSTLVIKYNKITIRIQDEVTILPSFENPWC